MERFMVTVAAGVAAAIIAEVIKKKLVEVGV